MYLSDRSSRTFHLLLTIICSFEEPENENADARRLTNVG
jgi:hypothetical protein